MNALEGGEEPREILQENHYYPFGMGMGGEWTPQVGAENQYQFNGKELNEDFGLDWIGMTMGLGGMMLVLGGLRALIGLLKNIILYLLIVTRPIIPSSILMLMVIVLMYQYCKKLMDT